MKTKIKILNLIMIFALVGCSNATDTVDGSSESINGTSTSREFTSDPMASRCGLEGTQLSWSGAQPKLQEKTIWSISKDESIYYPEPNEYGPAEEIDSLPACFQHSPEGAVQAAAYIFLLVGRANIDKDNLTSDELQAIGEFSKTFYFSSESSEDAVIAEFVRFVAGNYPPFYYPMGIVGYSVQNYSPTRAEIALLITDQNPKYYDPVVQNQVITITQHLTLNWENGDWKVLVNNSPEGVYMYGHLLLASADYEVGNTLSWDYEWWKPE
jgi:hypothetical protein